MTTAPVLLDTSIYVTALRAGDDAALQLRRFTSAPLWLSSVVLEELYAGVKPRDSRVLERLEHDFESAGRILVPNLSGLDNDGQSARPLRSEIRL